MAIPIESFQDILDVLEQNPEYREAMRRHTLDEEVRRLPAEFRELRKTVDDILQVVRDYVETANQRLGRLESDVDELKEGQSKLEAGQARLETGQTRLEGRIGDVAGTAYERRIAKHCRRIVGRHLGIGRAKVMHSINVTENEAFDNLIDAASEAGSITDEQAYDLDRADIILAGDSAPGQFGYAVIEVSETISDSDVDRAHERAAILARAISEPVAAAVIGKAVSDANRQRADQSGVNVIIMAE